MANLIFNISLGRVAGYAALPEVADGLIGPDEGAVPLATGRYRIWVRFTAGAERPVRNTGLLFIT